jgi:hypothetical protein
LRIEHRTVDLGDAGQRCLQRQPAGRQALAVMDWLDLGRRSAAGRELNRPACRSQTG